MSQPRVSESQAGTTAEVVIKALEKSGLSVLVTSPHPPDQLLQAIVAASPRLGSSIPVRNSLYKFDVSTIVIYWAVMATSNGSVAAFFPGRSDPVGGAAAYISAVIDPMKTLGAENIVETCNLGEMSATAATALSTAMEMG
jgi:hypothetical protein